MTRHLTKALMLIAVLGVAACNNPDRYANGTAGAGAGANAATGISSSPLGDPNDPKSIAYFNQTVGDTVHFAEDQSTLAPEAQQILATQATWLARNSDYGIIVEGHADERPPRQRGEGIPGRAWHFGHPDAHHQLWQGTPDCAVLGAAMLCREPPRGDGADTAGQQLRGVMR
jgi:hypothetical protein